MWDIFTYVIFTYFHQTGKITTTWKNGKQKLTHCRFWWHEVLINNCLTNLLLISFMSEYLEKLNWRVKSTSVGFVPTCLLVIILFHCLLLLGSQWRQWLVLTVFMTSEPGMTMPSMGQIFSKDKIREHEVCNSRIKQSGTGYWISGGLEMGGLAGLNTG